MTNEAFELIVRQTIKTLPHEFLNQLDNVEIVIEDYPSPNTPILGLYHGVPKTVRLGHFALPDMITIYKEPILAISKNDTEAEENIRDTVLHEIGHHFGLSDEELYKIKYKARK